jgi:hypothetical protein
VVEGQERIVEKIEGTMIRHGERPSGVEKLSQRLFVDHSSIPVCAEHDAGAARGPDEFHVTPHHDQIAGRDREVTGASPNHRVDRALGVCGDGFDQPAARRQPAHLQRLTELDSIGAERPCDLGHLERVDRDLDNRSSDH